MFSLRSRISQLQRKTRTISNRSKKHSQVGVLVRRGRTCFEQRLLIVGFVAVASLFSIGVTEVATASTPGWAEGRILVAPRSGLPRAEFNKILEKKGARSAKQIGKLDVHVVQVPPQAEEAVARALRKHPHIKFVEKDTLFPLEALIPNDPRYPDAWHLPKIAAPQAWDSTLGGDVVVAILDTGVDASHPDLSGNMTVGWNAASGNSNTSDVHGHGTSVAGTAAAVGNNGLGVASVAWNAQIMPIRVTNRTDGWAYTSDIARGLDWATDHGADVANISYDVTNSQTISSAAQRMRANGGVVVVAAGNSGTDPGYSDNPYIISVSATRSTDTRPSWSSFGDYVDVAAPGSGILSTTAGGGYRTVSGTSFASPVTAGVVALIMSANPLLSPSEVESILESGADDLGSIGWDPYYGHGRVNAYQSVVAAGGQSPPVDTQPPIATIESPSEGSTVSAIVPVNVSASDDVGVVRVDLYVNGTLYASDSIEPYAFSWDSNSVGNGSSLLTAYAHDAAGNEGISVSVSVLVEQDPLAPIVIDNRDGNTARTGTWSVSSGANPWGGQSLYSNSGSTFRWSPNLPEGGEYDVYAWWTYHPNRATDVPYRINHAAGIDTVLVNQHDSTLGGQWVLLGRYTFAAGSAGYIEVSSENGQACADAVRLLRLGTESNSVATPTITPAGGNFVDYAIVVLDTDTPGASIFYTLDGSDPTENSNPYQGSFMLTASATLKARAFLAGYQDSLVASAEFAINSQTFELIVDNRDVNTSRTGTWSVSSGTNPWGGQSLYSNSGSSFRWSLNLPEAGVYDVYAWWTYHPNRSTNVPYRINHATGIDTVVVNQHDPALGGQWVLLGRYTFTAGSAGYVEVSSENGQACADAVRLMR